MDASRAVAHRIGRALGSPPWRTPVKSSLIASQTDASNAEAVNRTSSSRIMDTIPYSLARFR
jgi:hypothetical protein